MTPEDKAMQLHLMFLRKLPFDKEVTTSNKHTSWTYDSDELASQHAIICVEEILDTIPTKYKEVHSGNSQWMKYKKYWQEVKKEIEKL